jgi:hypothetical protein
MEHKKRRIMGPPEGLPISEPTVIPRDIIALLFSFLGVHMFQALTLVSKHFARYISKSPELMFFSNLPQPRDGIRTIVFKKALDDVVAPLLWKLYPSIERVVVWGCLKNLESLLFHIPDTIRHLSFGEHARFSFGQLWNNADAVRMPNLESLRLNALVGDLNLKSLVDLRNVHVSCVPAWLGSMVVFPRQLEYLYLCGDIQVRDPGGVNTDLVHCELDLRDYSTPNLEFLKFCNRLNTLILHNVRSSDTCDVVFDFLSFHGKSWKSQNAVESETVTFTVLEN